MSTIMTDNEKAARAYLIMQAVRRGLPIGFEESRPIVTLIQHPILVNPEVLKRMTKRQSAMDWLRNRITTAPKGV